MPPSEKPPEWARVLALELAGEHAQFNVDAVAHALATARADADEARRGLAEAEANATRLRSTVAMLQAFHDTPMPDARAALTHLLTEAEARGRKAGLEEAAGIADSYRLSEAATSSAYEAGQHDAAVDIVRAIRSHLTPTSPPKDSTNG